MAQCRNCSAKVGCGCQLKDGLCGTCDGLKNQAKIIAPKSQEDVTTKTN